MRDTTNNRTRTITPTNLNTGTEYTQANTSTYSKTLKILTEGSDDAMHCLYLNARSNKSVTSKQNKLVDLQNLVALTQPNVVAITETWLNMDICDSEKLPPNYVVYRKDRSETCANKSGGGVLLGIDSRYTSKRLIELEPGCEILVCEILMLHSPKMAIILCYRSPNTDKSAFDETLLKVSRHYQHVCMLGDFNLPSISWSSLNSNVMPAEEMFMDVVHFYSLEQINSVPSNAHGNILDLVLTNMCEMYSNVSAYDSPLNTHDSLFNADHTILVFDVITKPKCKAASERVVFNYGKAIFTDICICRN